MATAPQTRNSLILRLRDREDRDSWREFVGLYEPVILRIARRKGMQHADAAELVQRVFLAISRAIDRWQPDPDKGRFRSWLYRITHNEFCKQMALTNRHTASGDPAVHALLQQHAQEELSDEFSIEYRRSVFRLIAQRLQQRVHATTWQAFWLTSVDGVPIDTAAAQLNMSVGAVYVARSRVMARLQREAAQFRESGDAM